MKKILIPLLTLLAVSFSFGQELAMHSSPDIDKVYTEVDESCKYPGGIVKLYEDIVEEINYPEEAAKKNIKGRVFIQFIVEKDGSLSNIQVAKSLGFGCDEEALRIFKEMPKWSPGRIDGQPVRQKFISPIYFHPKLAK
ncbi:MAG: energy transducer TonB [Ekhidna sp.]